MDYFLQLMVSGLSLGAVYALTAIGYSMVYGVLELINFAHGTVFMVGAYLYYILSVFIPGLPWYLAFILAIALTGLIGIVYEKLTVRPLREAEMPKFAGLICLIGVSTVLQQIVFLFMGSTTKQYPLFYNSKVYYLGNITVNRTQLLILGTTVVVLLFLLFFVNRTKIGMGMRAVAQEANAAEMMGISVNGIISLTFFIGSALACLSGVLSCMNFRGVDISIGNSIAIKAFTATVLGGIGNLWGAAIGAFIISYAEVMTAGYITSNLRDFSAYAILIVILLIKPDGLFSKKVQKKV